MYLPKKKTNALMTKKEAVENQEREEQPRGMEDGMEN